MLVILNESLKMPWPHHIPANVTGKGHLIIACFREKKNEINTNVCLKNIINVRLGEEA